MTQEEIVQEGLKIAKNLEAAINNLRSEGDRAIRSLRDEGEKIANDLIRRVERLEDTVSKCSVLESDSEVEDVEQVEKFNVVYRNDGSNQLGVTDEKFSDEDDFYNTYGSDDYSFVQFVDGSGEMMDADEN